MLAYVYELMLKECLLHPGGLHKQHRALPTKAPFSRLQWCVKWTSLTEQEWHTVQKGQGMKGILKILSSYTVMSQIRAYLGNCFWLTLQVCVCMCSAGHTSSVSDVLLKDTKWLKFPKPYAPACLIIIWFWHVRLQILLLLQIFRRKFQGGPMMKLLL